MINISTIIKEIWGIIVSPRKTLDNISKKEYLLSALIIVLIATILQSISIIFQLKDFTTPLVIIWVIRAGMFRLIARIFEGKGDYKKILQLYGYTCAIFFIYWLVFIIVAVTIFPIVPINVSLVITKILGLILIIWSIILSIFAISIAENLSLIKAFFVWLISSLLILGIAILIFMLG
jgi:hypothetical protein